jgi:hypothetical protein
MNAEELYKEIVEFIQNNGWYRHALEYGWYEHPHHQDADLGYALEISLEKSGVNLSRPPLGYEECPFDPQLENSP